MNFENYTVKQIQYSETKDLILNYHYAARMPIVMFAFGLFSPENELVGVITYGKPASPTACDGLCGKEYSKEVLELNRLVLKYNKKNQASFFISKTFEFLPKPCILISYADTTQNHNGYVYQATNWLYLGLSEIRKHRVFIDGTIKHGRHVVVDEIENFEEITKLVPRPRKHRYVMFLGTKQQKKERLASLRYKIVKDYPKNT